MKKIMKVIAAASLLVSLWGPSAVLAAAPEPVKAASVTVVDKSYLDKAVQIWAVRHYTDGGFTNWLVGSGFFVEGGYIVGAQHSVQSGLDSMEEEGERVEFYIKDGNVKSEAHSVEVVATDKNLDLALFKSDLVDHPYFELADVVSEGQEINVIGNSEMRAGVHTGFVEFKGNIVRLSDWTTIYNPGGPILSATYRMHATASALPGDSGAPTLNNDNEVVGVLIGALYSNQNAIIVKLEDVKSFVSTSFASLNKGVIHASAKNPS